MAVTAHTNTNLHEIAALLKEPRSFAICGHIGTDGDCLGSELALAEALRLLGKEVYTLIPRDEQLDPAFAFMKGFDQLIPASHFESSVDSFITVDGPSRERMADAVRVLDSADLTITIDHHSAFDRVGEYTYADPGVASTTMLIWSLISELGVEPTSDIATCCYAGLMTDTGRFQYQNADAAAFSAAAQMVEAGARADEISKAVYQRRSLASVLLEARAIDHLVLSDEGTWALTYLTKADFSDCGAVKADGEPIIDIIRSVEGLRVACVLREQDDIIRGSFRAKDDTDVAAIARDYEGGGHKAAAGFTLHCGMQEAISLITDRLNSELAVHHG